MGDEMKQAETGMPSLTLEPDFAPEVKKSRKCRYKDN